MRLLACVFLILALLIGGTASAQNTKGWLGADLLDVTKAEANKLGWDMPHGAKIGVVASGSPAEKTGLKSGDIILSIDRMIIDTSSEADAAVAAKRPGDELRLQVLSAGHERRATVTLAERPQFRAAQEVLPLLMLDVGGHMAKIRGVAFHTDRRATPLGRSRQGGSHLASADG